MDQNSGLSSPVYVWLEKEEMKSAKKRAMRNLIPAPILEGRFFVPSFSSLDSLNDAGDQPKSTDQGHLRVFRPLIKPPHATVDELRGTHGKELQAEVSPADFCTAEEAPGRGASREKGRVSMSFFSLSLQRRHNPRRVASRTRIATNDFRSTDPRRLRDPPLRPSPALFLNLLLSLLFSPSFLFSSSFLFSPSLPPKIKTRWYNSLDPSLNREPFSAAEEEAILEQHARFGNSWSAIARALPGRTDNAVKNRWCVARRGHVAGEWHSACALNNALAAAA